MQLKFERKQQTTHTSPLNKSVGSETSESYFKINRDLQSRTSRGYGVHDVTKYLVHGVIVPRCRHGLRLWWCGVVVHVSVVGSCLGCSGQDRCRVPVKVEGRVSGVGAMCVGRAE